MIYRSHDNTIANLISIQCHIQVADISIGSPKAKNRVTDISIRAQRWKKNKNATRHPTHWKPKGSWQMTQTLLLWMSQLNWKISALAADSEPQAHHPTNPQSVLVTTWSTFVIRVGSVVCSSSFLTLILGNPWLEPRTKNGIEVSIYCTILIDLASHVSQGRLSSPNFGPSPASHWLWSHVTTGSKKRF